MSWGSEGLDLAKRLSRRAFLGGGTAVAIGLPCLDAMLPRRARADDAAACKRFVAIFTPNGMPMAKWTPAATGPDYPLSEALQDLAPVKQHVSVLSNLQIRAVDGPAGHAPGTAGFLTCTRVAVSETNPTNNKSVDQVYADSIQGQTPTSLMALAMIGGSEAGTCDAAGYACSYLANISWNGNSPNGKHITPQAAFDLVVGGADPGLSAQEKALRRAKRLSVLDSVIDEAAGLKTKLGASDNAKVDEYLDSVRDLELRVEAEDPSAVDTCDPEEPQAYFDIDEKTDAFLDVIAMALQCDRTRAVTFMLGKGLNSLAFNFMGIGQGHHGLSHSGNADDQALYLQIAQWEVAKFARLVEKLAAIDEGGTSVLDNTILYLGNGISSGSGHTHSNMPILVAGGANLGLSPGRHVHYPSEPPVANLFIRLLNALDVPVTTFGDDGTQPLADV